MNKIEKYLTEKKDNKDQKNILLSAGENIIKAIEYISKLEKMGNKKATKINNDLNKIHQRLLAL